MDQWYRMGTFYQRIRWKKKKQTKQDYESQLKKEKSVKESTLLQMHDNISDFSTNSSGSCALFGIDWNIQL